MHWLQIWHSGVLNYIKTHPNDQILHPDSAAVWYKLPAALSESTKMKLTVLSILVPGAGEEYRLSSQMVFRGAATSQKWIVKLDICVQNTQAR